MASITIRNLPEELVERVKAAARANKRSMEQELRELLQARYQAREQVLDSVETSWSKLPDTPADLVDRWLDETRNREG